MGARTAGQGGGGDFAHPASCQCFKCFAAKSKAGIDPDKSSRAARHAGTADSLPAPSGRGRGAAAPKHRARRGGGGGTADADTFATVGETLWTIETASDVAKLAMQVEASRRAAGHKLNDRSSRSHCLVRLHLTTSTSTSVTSDDATTVATTAATPPGERSPGRRLVRRRQFLFVDLAGSERTAKSGVAGERLTEATTINKSLTVLGRVIRTLGKGEAHVPHRDSTLTLLLRSSFDVKAGAGAHASVVINVAPGEAYQDETMCSLRFGERMARVGNRATLAAGADAGEEQARLQAEVGALRRKVLAMTEAGMGGCFVAGAVLSEVKSLRANQQRWDEATRQLRELRRQLTEATTTTAGKYDHRRRPVNAPGAQPAVREIERRLAAALATEATLRAVLERQKTIKKLWAPPKPTFLAARAELIALETRLAAYS